MGERISAMVNEDLDVIIEAVAEHHSISKSSAIELLLREGVQAREMRYRFEQLDAKLDHLLENLGTSTNVASTVEERFETVTDRPVPAGVSGVELADSPLPYFQSAGSYPDRSDEEAAVRESVINEREWVGEQSTSE